MSPPPKKRGRRGKAASAAVVITPEEPSIQVLQEAEEEEIVEHQQNVADDEDHNQQLQEDGQDEQLEQEQEQEQEHEQELEHEQDDEDDDDVTDECQHKIVHEGRKEIVVSGGGENSRTVVLLTHSGEKVGEGNQIFTILDDGSDHGHQKNGDESVVIVTLPQNEDKSSDGGNDSGGINSEELSFFHCIICRETYVSQKDFFHHLKDHYEEEGNSAGSNSAAMLPSSSAPQMQGSKKRGRKSKVEIMAEEKRAILKMKKKAKKLERITRSGRVSKPRMRDVDMISSVKVKLEVPDEDDIEDEDYLNEIAADKDGDYDVEKDEADAAEDRSFLSASPGKKPRRTGSYSVTNAKKIKSEDGGPDKYECNVCHKHYANSTSISVHMRIHKGERPYKCPICGRAFRQYSDLKYHHQSLHNDKKAFQCEFCGKEFSRKYSLNIHQKIHTGVRDYKCDICQKGFRAAIYVQEHRRIHTGEKPFLCDVCGRGFRIKSDMLRHRINVHFKGSKLAAAKNITKEELVEEETPEYILAEAEEDKDGNLTGETYAAHLVYISENEAVLVTQS